MKTLINIILFTVLVQTLTAAPAKSWTYAYNDTGARKQVVEDGELTDDTINIAGQVISRTGLPENSYAYDNDGNLESDPNWDYIFNEANQLIRMDNKEAVGYAVTFSYDFSGRRYQKSVLLDDVVTERTTYVYDGQRVIAEINTLDADTANHELEKTYTYGLYIDELLSFTNQDGDTYYVTTDRQYSVRSIVDSDGNVEEERNYDPFGKDMNGAVGSGSITGLDYGFTGRRLDKETGLHYFRSRYYSDELGSFISRDRAGYIDGLSLYSGYFAQQMLNDWSGLGKGKAVGWVVTKIAGKSKSLIKRQALYTEKAVAKALFKKGDVLVRGGAGKAKSIAKNIAKRYKGKQRLGDILRHDGHRIKNELGEYVATGAKHVQFDRLSGKHIFYTSFIAAMALQSDADSAQSESIIIDELYTDPYPGESVANYLTVTKYAGDDSLLSYLDWINPGELIAMGGDLGRNYSREKEKVFMGLLITIKDCNKPTFTITLNDVGGIESVFEWKDGKVSPTDIKNVANSTWGKLNKELNK